MQCRRSVGLLHCINPKGMSDCLAYGSLYSFNQADIMHAYSRIIVLSTAFLVLTFSDYAKGEEGRLKTCIVNLQKELGVSADTAYAECSRRTFADCIKEMAGKKYVALAVGQKDIRYIVDAGNEYTRWMEGSGWRVKGCEPHGEGPRRDSTYENAWGTQKRTFFRQGACPSGSLELDQVNSLQEAEVLCKSKQ